MFEMELKKEEPIVNENFKIKQEYMHDELLLSSTSIKVELEDIKPQLIHENIKSEDHEIVLGETIIQNNSQFRKNIQLQTENLSLLKSTTITEINEGKSDFLSHIKDDIDVKPNLLMEEYDIPTIKSEDYIVNPLNKSSGNKLKSIQKFKKALKKTNPSRCPICNKSQVSTVSRTKHIKNHFGKQHIIICHFCGKSFIEKNEFLNHLFVHKLSSVNRIRKDINEYANVNIFQNESGAKNFKKKINLNFQNNNIIKKPHTCEVCLKSFRKRTELKIHTRLHTGEKPYKCEICLKLFIRKDNLKSHMITHTAEKPFKCKLCSKVFKRLGQLNIHMRIHSGEKPFKCEVCSNSFRHSSSLKSHMNIHTDKKPFKCEICSKLFRLAPQLNIHMGIHSSEKPFKCVICFQSFKHSSSLKSHMNTHTGEGLHKCEICLKSYLRKTSLKIHMYTHTGAKQFKCEICSKSFDYKSNMVTHMRNHTDEKLFKCPTCFKGFKRDRYLKAHIKTHMTKRQFKCKICLKEFTRMNLFNRHKCTHCKETPLKCCP